VSGIRAVESALGDGRKRPTSREVEMAAVARKSLVAIRDIAEGGVVEAADIAVLRPGTGIPPAMRSSVIGRRTRRAVRSGEVLSLDHLT
jgi:N,N'-diacetyllegionaminate synthase